MAAGSWGVLYALAGRLNLDRRATMQGYPKRKRTERELIAASFRAAFKKIDTFERRWKALPEDVRLANPDLARWFAEAPRLDD